MNVNFYLTKDYENEPRFQTPGKQTQYEPNQSRSEFTPKGAEIPTGGLLGILKPGTNFKGKKMVRSLSRGFLREKTGKDGH